MKKWIGILLLAVFLIPVIIAETPYHYLTKGLADTIYCSIGGSCTLEELTVDNLSVIGEVFNVSVVNYNVTGDLSVSGNITADTFLGDDSQTATFIVAASDSLHKETADYVCDGTADEVEIESALNALPTTGGKIVLLEGTFNLNGDIAIPDDDISVEGQGISTILKSSKNNIFYVSGQNRLSFDNMQILGTSATVNVGISCLGDSDDIHITRILFNNLSTGMNNLFSNGNTGFQISDNKFWNIDGDAIFLAHLRSGVISNNIIKSSPYADFIDITGHTVSAMIITGNTGDNVTHGIILSGGDNNAITNNVIRYSRHEGIELNTNSDGNLISGNVIQNANRTGIYITGNSANNILSSNRVTTSNADSGYYEININSGVGNMVLSNNLHDKNNNNSLLNSGTNTTIYFNYPGRASMEITTPTNEEIKIQPSEVLTMELHPNKVNITGGLNVSGQIYENGTSLKDKYAPIQSSGTSVSRFHNGFFETRLT